jgi:hypothetical protein
MGPVLCEEDRIALFSKLNALSENMGFSRFCLTLGMSRRWWHRTRRAGKFPASLSHVRASSWCSKLGLRLSAILKKKRQRHKQILFKESITLMCIQLENVCTINYSCRRRLLYELNEALICDSRHTVLNLSREQSDSQRITVINPAGISVDLLIATEKGRSPIPHLVITPKDAGVEQAYAALAINASLYSTVLATIRNIITNHAAKKNLSTRFDGAVSKKIAAYHA